MEVEQKVWGTVRHLVYGPVCTSLLKVDAQTFCSIHRHHRRWNHFLVTEGIVDVVLYAVSPLGMLQITNRIQLTGNPSLGASGYAVAPTVWHRFEVVRGGWIVEAYWTADGTPADIKDIERRQEGGRF